MAQILKRICKITLKEGKNFYLVQTFATRGKF